MSNAKQDDVVTLLWTIENFNEFFPRQLESPTFLSNSLECTSWKITLYHNKDNNDDNSISLTLTRYGSHQKEVDRVILDCEMSIIEEDGLPLVSKQTTKHGFVTNHSWSPCKNFASIRDIFDEKFAYFLPGNILHVRCRMWRSFNKTTESELLISDTNIERTHFVWKINNFSRLKKNDVKEIHVKQMVSESPILSYKFYTDGISEEAIIEISLGGKNFIVDLFCEIMALDCSGKEIDSDSNEMTLFCGNSTRLPPFLKLSKFFENTKRYLPMDVLSLRIDCFFMVKDITDTSITHISMRNFQIYDNLLSAEQSVSKEREEISLPSRTCDKQSMTENLPIKENFDKQSMIKSENIKPYLCKSESTSERETCSANHKTQHNLKRFVQDMHCMYEEGLLSDFTLCAGNRDFPVHKSILSARSPVFKAMFTTPLKEKDGKVLDIPDIDGDTLHRMLLFVYSNEMRDLDWEDAINLYFAADKYNIEDLKSITSSVLKSKLSVSNVCEILVHADLHEDQDLKCSAMEFIATHDDEILGNENWKKFQKKHMPLTMEILSVLYTKMKKRIE